MEPDYQLHSEALRPHATAIIVNDSGDVLTGEYTQGRNKLGQRGSSGGGIEPGETPADTMKREASEEMGVDIELFGEMAVCRCPLSGAEVYYSLARIVRGEPTATPEMANFAWQRVDEALADTVNVLSPRIRKVFELARPAIKLLEK